jgi:hypothetical protein
MNAEQRDIFCHIVQSVQTFASLRNPSFPPFFLEGKPGRGKMFVVNAICNHLRGENHIILIVGSSALAATLYDGGRTAHNLFQIPVTEVRTSILQNPYIFDNFKNRTIQTSSRLLDRFHTVRNLFDQQVLLRGMSFLPLTSPGWTVSTTSAAT